MLSHKQNSEQIISCGYDQLVFRDSFRCLSSALDKLVKLIMYERVDVVAALIEHWSHNFRYRGQRPNVNHDADLHMATDKGVYPYAYMECGEHAIENALPSTTAFYSLLSEPGITQTDYERSCAIWKRFNLEQLGQYLGVYLEQVGDMCLAYYGLYHVYYYTLPNAAWDEHGSAFRSGHVPHD